MPNVVVGDRQVTVFVFVAGFVVGVSTVSLTFVVVDVYRTRQYARRHRPMSRHSSMAPSNVQRLPVFRPYDWESQ